MSTSPAIAELEARALWHLEIGYPAPSARWASPALDDEDDGDYLGHITCWSCGGEGFKIVCCDDICHGQGYCMHGDGHQTCRECDGEGAL